MNIENLNLSSKENQASYLFLQAEQKFFQVLKNILENNLLKINSKTFFESESNVIDAYVKTKLATSDLAFICECYLKSMLLLSGFSLEELKRFHGHNLLKLYKVLPEEIKRAVKSVFYSESLVVESTKFTRETENISFFPPKTRFDTNPLFASLWEPHMKTVELELENMADVDLYENSLAFETNRYPGTNDFPDLIFLRKFSAALQKSIAPYFGSENFYNQEISRMNNLIMNNHIDVSDSQKL